MVAQKLRALAVSVLLLLPASASCIPADDEQMPRRRRRTIQLIRDPNFQQGFRLVAPELDKNRKRLILGNLLWRNDQKKPIWHLVQWHSKHPLAPDTARKLPSGAFCFTNKAKRVIVGPPGCEDAHLVLGIDSRPEYKGKARQKGQPWPHLLVEQPLRDLCPFFNQIQRLQFHVEARLRHAERFETSQYTTKLHCAQFSIVLIVQNRNVKSPGFGDFLWFQIPVYDDRWDIPPRYVAQDYADPSAKLIYRAAGRVYTNQSLHDHKWVTIEKDNLLPLIQDALSTAWERGYLKDSHNIADYKLSSINLGWEITGINNVELQLRDLRLTAVLTHLHRCLTCSHTTTPHRIKG